MRPSLLSPLLLATRIHARGSPWLPLGVMLGGLVLLASSADSQGLGDAAAREETKRKTEPGEAKAKVFTNDDLASEEKPAEESGEAESSDEEAIAPEGESTRADGRESDEEWRERTDREREKRVRQEREWRARFTEARAKVREEEAKCWQEVVRTEFYQGIPVQMKVKEFVESEAYRQAKKDLADLQEQFRRAGLPPGWARP